MPQPPRAGWRGGLACPPTASPNGDRADLDSIVGTVTVTDQQAIADTARILDRSALAEAVSATSAARRIDIFGVGASAVVALDLQQKLHRIGLIAYQWSDTHAALTAAARSTRGTSPSGSRTPVRRGTRSRR
ncbi:MurR/RpiR family transcriptional regulator [Pseudonocardia acidicola]|uniref:MurR/RpiR family transcriptional regulator n=1 Tax=Pseudonocardia acidicola TaxID=2724939 RepID=UPI001B7CE994|nr:MurR/RpiR family transcriptional regulator [Pseudonocardia acidicola]